MVLLRTNFSPSRNHLTHQWSKFALQSQCCFGSRLSTLCCLKIIKKIDLFCFSPMIVLMSMYILYSHVMLLLLRLHDIQTKSVFAVAFSHDGTLVASTHADHTIRVLLWVFNYIMIGYKIFHIQQHFVRNESKIITIYS